MAVGKLLKKNMFFGKVYMGYGGYARMITNKNLLFNGVKFYCIFADFS